MSSPPEQAVDSLDKTIKQLVAARTQLADTLEARLSHYANDKLLWSDRATHRTAAVKDTDPKMIQAFKHGLLFLEGMEQLLLIFKEFQKKHLGIKVLQLPLTAYQSFSLIYNDLLTHSTALYSLTTGSNAPVTLLNAVKKGAETLAGLAWNDMTIVNLKNNLLGTAPNLSSAVTTLLNSYISPDRPIILQEHENLYQTPKPPANPGKSAQQELEWFPLLDTMRDIMNGTRNISTLLSGFLNTKYQDKPNSQQLEVIRKAEQALEKAPIKRGGYFEYLAEGADEAALSNSLKAIFNLMLSLDKLVSGLPKAPEWRDFGTITATLLKDTVSTTKRVKKALEHLGKIDFKGLGKDFKTFSTQLTNATLFYLNEHAYPKLAQLSVLIHQVELQNNLRYGSLMTREMRSLLDPLETFALGQGVSLQNPFDVDPSESITSKVTEYKANEATHAERKSTVDRISLLLKQYTEILPPFDDHLELLKELFKLRPFGLLKNKEELAALASLESRLILELPLKQKIKLLEENKTQQLPEWTDRVERAIISDKERSNKWFYERLREDLTTGYEEGRSWPTPDIETIQMTVDHIRRELSQETIQYEENLEALQLIEAKNLTPPQYALRILENEGLNHLMRASQVAEEHPEMNLYQKRRLAVLNADLNNKARGPALANAHEEALKFRSQEAQSLVEQVGRQNSALGQILAVELSLGGQVPVTAWRDNTILELSAELKKRCLLRVIDTLEAQQILQLIKEPQRVKLFQEIFPSPQPQLLPLPQETLSKEQLFDLCLSTWSFNQADTTLRAKLGSFVGRLAHADKELAQLVFAHPEGPAMIRSSDQGIYHEALISTFNLPAIFNERKLQTYPDFVIKSRDLITTLHRILHPENPEKTASEINDYYQKSPWELCQLIEKFITTKLTSNSQAENEMRVFFSELVLSKGKQGQLLRDNILSTQLASSGLSQAPYMGLMTNEASFSYWAAVNNDLVKSKHQLFDDLNDLGGPFKYTPEWESFIKELQGNLDKLTKANIEPKKFPIYSRYVKQEMEEAKELATKKFEFMQAKKAQETRTSSRDKLFTNSSRTPTANNSAKPSTNQAILDLVLLINNSLSTIRASVITYIGDKKAKGSTNDKSQTKDSIADEIFNYINFMKDPNHSAEEKLSETSKFYLRIPELVNENKAAVDSYNAKRDWLAKPASVGTANNLLAGCEKALEKHIQEVRQYLPALKP